MLAINDESALECPQGINASERDDQFVVSDLCSYCHAAATLLRCCETGFQVGEDVFDGLETNRQTHETREYTS